MIPDDVTVQVLTQAREHIIKKTFEAVKGAPHAVIHLYNSTSVAQREQVFKKSKEEVKQIAIDGAKLLNKLASETEGNFSFEYRRASPAQSRSTPWKSATQYLMYGSQRLLIKQSLIFQPLSKMQCRMYLPLR